MDFHPSQSLIYTLYPFFLSLTYISNPDLKRELRASPPNFSRDPDSLQVPRLRDFRRRSAANLKLLERRQLALLSRQSVDPRSTIRSTSHTVDCSLQSNFIFPHVIRGRFAYLFPLLCIIHHGTIHLCYKRFCKDF